MSFDPVSRLSSRPDRGGGCPSPRSTSASRRLYQRSTVGGRGRDAGGMSPGATMERVYLDLKARILAGTYPPGTRLEAAQLAKSLASSATPVRDALYRLSGERIIESWHQEGFRQPLLSEADLVDLYWWTGALLL
ncbi:MAG: GntR family transcriptional regulator, partial [Sphingopyxis terrae]